MLLLTVSTPSSNAPLSLALLPEKVLLLTFSVPPFMMPPAYRLALLPEKTLLLTLTVPLRWLKIPPPKSALLPEKVPLLTYSVPRLSMPPP